MRRGSMPSLAQGSLLTGTKTKRKAHQRGGYGYHSGRALAAPPSGGSPSAFVQLAASISGVVILAHIRNLRRRSDGVDRREVRASVGPYSGDGLSECTVWLDGQLTPVG